MNTSSPSCFQRRILLAVTGLSPQVVTETVYALFRKGASFIPSEIHLITTVEGAERARLSLLSESPGWFHRLCHDYDLPPIRFDSGSIHVLQTPDGRPLTDIRSPEDNRLAADFITEKVRELSADANAVLHVSIAGGRKTMGFFLGYALSLFGRPQDSLSHVLVSAPFESSWQFFYPTPREHIIETHDKKLVDAREAIVSLAEIPFVSLRHGLPANLLKGHTSYANTVAAARASLGPLSLSINLVAKQITVGECIIKVGPGELALLALLARRAINREEALPVPSKYVGDKELAEAYLLELDIIFPDKDHREENHRTYRALKDGMDGETFSPHMSKLRKALGKPLASSLIDNGGKCPTRYWLKIAPENIRFIP